jgi:hypothetical protein
MIVIPVTVDLEEAERFPARLLAAIGSARDEIGAFLVDRIRENISRGGEPEPGGFPRARSGVLAQSIAYRVDGDRVVITASADYAADLELGEHPFMGRTLRESEAEVKLIAERKIREALA